MRGGMGRKRRKGERTQDGEAWEPVLTPRFITLCLMPSCLTGQDRVFAQIAEFPSRRRGRCKRSGKQRGEDRTFSLCKTSTMEVSAEPSEEHHRGVFVVYLEAKAL